MTGKVIGINTRGGGQNLNFAIPIDVAKEVISRILTTAKDGKKGRVDRSDLGIDFKPLQDLETFYNIDINRGVLVNSVDRNSPAEKAGVKSQDILLDVNEKPVNVRFPEEIAAARKLIADLPIGTDVNLTLKRGGKTITLTAKTEKLQGVVGEEKEFKSWGISVRELTRAYANEARLDDTQGVVVTTLNIGYPAEKAGLDRGDVIRSVNRKPVTDLDSFSALYDASIKKKDKVVVLEVQRGQGRHASVLKVSYDEE
jgi:serine protease Do